jgi:segregation and condensation protein A
MVERLRKSGRLTFRELVADCQDRAELVARFLGILELYRIGAARFEQHDPFSDFNVVWEDKTFAMDNLSLLGADYAD